MDFLKKLLFPSKPSNTLQIEPDQSKEAPILDLLEDDIDNFVSESSVEGLLTSKSIASIASLFSHLDELDLIQRDDLTINSREKPEDLKHDDKKPEVQNSSLTDKNNDTEDVLAVNPKENNVSNSQILSETDPIKTNEELNAVDGPTVNNAATVDHLPKTSCNENKNAQFITNPQLPVLKNGDSNSNVNFSTTAAEIDHSKEYSPQQSSGMLKFVNLGSEEVNLCPDLNKATCSMPNFNDMCLDQVANGLRTNGGIPKCDEDKDFKGDLRKKAKLNKVYSTSNNQIVIDLTQSEDEIEPNTCTEHRIPKIDPPQNKLHFAVKYAANFKRDKPLLLLHLTPASAELNVCKITHPHSKTISQVLTNDADTRRTIPAAKNTTAAAPNDDVNEIISISSTDDESEPRTLDEHIEPDTISCDDIQFYPDANSAADKSVTGHPSSNTRNDLNTNCNKSDDSNDKAYDSDYCSGYHSSDFEFISENEASMDGLIINYKSDQNKSKHNVELASSTVRTIEIAKEPVRNRNIHQNESRNYVIPQGNEYLKLFEHVHMMNIARYMENKSVFRSVNTTMLVEYNTLEQNMRLMRKLDQIVDNEYKEEAEETAKKIREMYPEPNRKRQRRF